MKFNKNLLLFTLLNLLFTQNINSNPVNLSKRSEFSESQNAIYKIISIIDYTFLSKITCAAGSIVLDSQKSNQNKFLRQI